MTHLTAAWDLIFSMSLHASALIAFVLVLRLVAGRRLPAQCFVVLWLLVAVRLLLPVVPRSPASFFNLFSARSAQPLQATGDWKIRTETIDQSAASYTSKPREVAGSAAGLPTAESRLPWLALVWLSGMAAQVGQLASAAWRLHRRMRSAEPLTDPALTAFARECAEMAGWRGSAELLETDAIVTPAVVGLWRPRLLIPKGWIQQVSADDLRLALLHEYTHLRRRDLATLWLVTCARVVHWFNPLAWCCERLAYADTEQACDEAVLRSSARIDPLSYGAALLRMAQFPPHGRVRLPQASVVAGHRGLQARLARVAAFRIATGWQRAAVLSLLLGSSVFFTEAEVEPKAAAPSAEAPAASAEATAGKAVATPVAPWAAGWKVLHIDLCKDGWPGNAIVELQAPGGRTFKLSRGRTSNEGVTLLGLAWIGSPIAARVTLSKDGTKAEIDVESARIGFQPLQEPPALQVEVEARFIAYAPAAAQQFPILDVKMLPPPSTGNLAGVLKKEEADETLRKLIQTARGVDLLSAPRMTVLSGQRGTIEIIREFSYPLAWLTKKAGQPWKPSAWEKTNLGTSLEVCATQREGQTIDLEIAPQVNWLRGIIDADSGKPLLTVPQDFAAQVPPTAQLEGRHWKPVFRSSRKITTSVSIFNGQTVVLTNLVEPGKPDGFKPLPDRRVALFLRAVSIRLDGIPAE